MVSEGFSCSRLVPGTFLKTSPSQRNFHYTSSLDTTSESIEALIGELLIHVESSFSVGKVWDTQTQFSTFIFDIHDYIVHVYLYSNYHSTCLHLGFKLPTSWFTAFQSSWYPTMSV
jgi:hypothetical protein